MFWLNSSRGKFCGHACLCPWDYQKLNNSAKVSWTPKADTVIAFGRDSLSISLRLLYSARFRSSYRHLCITLIYKWWVLVRNVELTQRIIQRLLHWALLLNQWKEKHSKAPFMRSKSFKMLDPFRGTLSMVASPLSCMKEINTHNPLRYKGQFLYLKLCIQQVISEFLR